MKNIIIDNCQACTPINNLISILEDKKFQIIEQKINDYHFKELYFKIQGNIEAIKDIN
jgi:hypothetical protein